MTFRKTTNAVLVALIAIGLTACGGNKTSTTTNTEMKTAATPYNGAEVPAGAMAPVNVKCGAVKPVWVNLKSKAYHEPGDPWYGRTKNGQYMCPSQAAAQGYHLAGARHKGAMESSGAGASGYGGGAHPRSGTVTPNPYGTP